MRYIKSVITVAETALFTKQASKLFSEAELEGVIDSLAFNPIAGDLIPGSGGLRKLRVAASGRGKRGGARVVYYYHSDTVPLFALAVYAKNVKTDLTKAELARLSGLVERLKPRKNK